MLYNLGSKLVYLAVLRDHWGTHKCTIWRSCSGCKNIVSWFEICLNGEILKNLNVLRCLCWLRLRFWGWFLSQCSTLKSKIFEACWSWTVSHALVEFGKVLLVKVYWFYFGDKRQAYFKLSYWSLKFCVVLSLVWILIWLHWDCRYSFQLQ